MTSSHLILCRPLLLLPSIPPNIGVFSNESTLHMRWPKYWSFIFRIIPSKEHPGLISFRMDSLDLLAAQGTLKSLLQHHSTAHQLQSCLNIIDNGVKLFWGSMQNLSSLTRDWTRVTCNGSASLNHCTIREYSLFIWIQVLTWVLEHFLCTCTQNFPNCNMCLYWGLMANFHYAPNFPLQYSLGTSVETQKFHYCCSNRLRWLLVVRTANLLPASVSDYRTIFALVFKAPFHMFRDVEWFA